MSNCPISHFSTKNLQEEPICVSCCDSQNCCYDHCCISWYRWYLFMHMDVQKTEYLSDFTRKNYIKCKNI